jgi:AraC-like DNA-binding protein
MGFSIRLHSPFSAKEILSLSELPAFCTLSFQDARYTLYTLKNGKILLQTLPHYLVDIELFEYVIDKTTKIDFTVTKASFTIMVMLSGYSVLRDEQGNLLTETHGNSCYLSQLNAGKYSRTFLEGHHKVLMLNINTDFIIQQSGRFSEIQPAIKNYSTRESNYFKLPNAPIAKGIYKLLKKLNAFTVKQSIDYDKKVMNFLIETLKQYHKNIHLRKISRTCENNKATEVASFLESDPYHQMINNKAKMALHFYLSERTMNRLAKKQFGKSLHQQVIELRLLHGLKLLQSTNKSVQGIADLIGYDRHYFSKAFKRHFGISPAQIRKAGQ